MITRKQMWLFCGLAATSCAVASASMYMRKLVEEKLFNQDFCKLSIDLLQEHKKSVNVLGPPLSFKRPTLENTFNNVSDTTASIALRVIGEKATGNLLVVASKAEKKDTNWTLKSVLLEMPDQKIEIKS